ncbi:MAG: AraC family transcriptional regulator N-terminal domain-containing protein [Myxococcota bacterium]
MDELIDIALRHTPGDGFWQTRVPVLSILRSAVTANRVPAVQRPMLCLIVQGAKEVTVGERVYRYVPPQYLLSTVDLPMTGEVIEATPRKPYLCFALAIEPATVYDVLESSSIEPAADTRSAVSVAKADSILTDAMLRLARCLPSANDCAVLAPGIVREITYRLLTGPLGTMVRDIGVVGSRTQRVAKAIAHLKNAFAEPVAIKELARLAGMSVSSFHEHFKKVTTLSPLQYQKQLRLHEARRLLLADAGGAGDAGFRVGYQSASQFSREYARYFGHPPTHDLRPRP